MSMNEATNFILGGAALGLSLGLFLAGLLAAVALGMRIFYWILDSL